MSQNPIEPWKLTAFLLNELELDDRQQVEAAIASNIELQKELESLRLTLDRTRSVLACPIVGAELAPANRDLIAKQIQAVESQAPSFPVVKASKPEESNWKWKALAALAASMLIGLLVWPDVFSPTHLAQVDDTPERMSISSSEPNAIATPASSFDSAAMSTTSSSSNANGTSLSSVEKLADSSNGSSEPANTMESARRSPVEELSLKKQLANDEPFINSPAATSVPRLSQTINPAGTKEMRIEPASDAPMVITGQTADGIATFPLAPSSKSLEPRGKDVEVDAFATDGKTGRFILGGSVNSELEKVAEAAKPNEANASATVPMDAKESLDATAGAGGMSGGMGGGGVSMPKVSAPQPKLKEGVEFQKQKSRSLDTNQLKDRDEDAFLPNVVADPNEPIGLQAAATPSEAKEHRFLEEDYARGIDSLRRLPNPPSGDRFEKVHEAPFVDAKAAPLSTFSVDVDTASYSKVRQYLMQANSLPQPNAVRIEEMINYFDYNYAGPTDEKPFASNMAISNCPWNASHQLIRIGLQAKKIEVKERPKANIVFLLDVSGSMDEPNKLPLVKQAITMMTKQLGENDRIAMVVYAGAAGCVLPSITGDHQAEILAALDNLSAGGSTNGGQGIELAYSIARDHFIAGGINRIILCTDGDFNVGTTSNEGLIRLVENNAKSKIFLTCLGFGMGNYNDSMMEQITNRGNGVYGMIDNIHEARRLMVEQLSGTLMAVAKDVKIQVEFNPTKIARYRLIGYENRRLANADFNNDAKDAGEIGAGHRVTALYEIIPVGAVSDALDPPVDELRYSKKKSEAKPDETSTAKATPAEEIANSDEWMTLKLRYKQPEGDVSSKVEFYLKDSDVKAKHSDVDFEWASAVAEFGLLLRRSQYAPQANWSKLISRAQNAAGDSSYRLECLEMMIKARALSN